MLFQSDASKDSSNHEDEDEDTFNFLYLLLIVPFTTLPLLAYYIAFKRKWKILRNPRFMCLLFIICLVLMSNSIFAAVASDSTTARSVALALAISTVILQAIIVRTSFSCCSKSEEDNNDNVPSYIYVITSDIRRASSSPPSYSEVVDVNSSNVTSDNDRPTAATDGTSDRAADITSVNHPKLSVCSADVNELPPNYEEAKYLD